MFGTVAIIRPKAGKEAELVAGFNDWWKNRAPKVKGAISSNVHKNGANPAELIMTVVFDSKESYTANANDPEQDRWYRQVREMLESDPKWMDGEVLVCHHV